MNVIRKVLDSNLPRDLKLVIFLWWLSYWPSFIKQ